MKRLILIVCTVIICTALRGQVIVDDIDINKMDSVQYCELMGIDAGLFTKKLQVVIDYGQKFKIGSDMRIQNAQGKAQVFNSMTHALNFMCNNGWEYVSSYTVSAQNSNVYHWLLRRKKQ